VTWRNVLTVSTWKVCITQVRLHNRRVHVRAMPVFLKIWCHAPLALCTCCVCFAKNVMTMCQQFLRLWYVSPCGLGFVWFFWREGVFFSNQIVHPNLVRESIWSLFQICFVVGRPIFLTTKSFMGSALPRFLTLTSLSVGVQGTRLPWALVLTTEGIRRGGFWDAIQWLRMRLYGACVSPGMRANPSTCRVSRLTLVGT